ncbi:WD40 repeat domain-containing protein [Aphanizomenon flos-aquae]|uniref:nSTAND1 domain-containing NTPase n=1 Tax=Aphanizomenon flos-aquae TaxID=1176 RepID=UPI0004B2E292|nr:WD40 repeat domain-containing protein [Aphanizomenon flos-aquae]
MSQQPPENSDSQQPDANSTQQADGFTPQNVVQGNQNRDIQGNENQGVLGDSNTVVQGNNSSQNIHITNYYYREDIRVAAVQPASDALSDEKLPCPYRGLFHFSPDDAEYFFGREVFIEELFRATQTRNFIPVLGASGSGKSSVVLAGLVPKLQQEGHWLFTHFRPGSNPFYGLAEALVPLYTPDLDDTDRIAQTRKLSNYFCNGDVLLVDVIAKIQQNHPNHRVLLIADQFEELYTLCNDEKTRHNLLDSLLTIIQSPTSKSLSTVFVATMRADFLSYALSYPEFADQLKADIKLIRSMNRSELSEVIAKPAQKLGIIFQDGLIERILNDVESEPGNLPLLEFALTLLWEKRTNKQLTHAAYETIGEVQGALTSYTDKKYNELNPDEREQVRRIFVQLVRPGEEAEDTRRLATKAELGEANWSLVKKLADARLVVTSQNATNQETVEVAHEALIRNWGELRQWMNKDRVFRAWQERLRVTKKQWEATNRDPGSLLRGAALAEAEEKLKERPEDLIDEKEFIEQSIQEGNRLKQAEAARRKREIRTTWGIAAGSLVAVVISTGLGLMAWKQTTIADSKTKEAELNLANSLARKALSLWNDNHKDLDTLLMAIKAEKLLKKHDATDPAVIDALSSTVSETWERNRLDGHTGSVRSLSFNQDGSILASGSFDNTIQVWDVKTGKSIRTLESHNKPVNSVSFNRDASLLASGSEDKTIKFWDVKTGRLIRTLEGHNDIVDSVSFNPDGSLLASGSWDKTIKLWDVKTGKLIRTLEGHNDSVNSISFNRDGSLLASGNNDSTINFWDVKTGNLIRTIKNGNDYLHSVNFNQDGSVLASGGEDKTIKLWDVKTGNLIRTLEGHKDIVDSVIFNPDGSLLASGSWDKTIKLWDVKTGKLIRTLEGHNDIVNSVSFNRDGSLLASAGENNSIELWDMKMFQEIRTLENHSNVVNNISFNQNGSVLASGGKDKTIKLWDVKKGKIIRTLEGHNGSVDSVSFNRDGSLLASGSGDKTIKLWDVKKGKIIRTLEGHNGSVNSVSFNRDGSLLASGSGDNTVKLWDVQTGQLISTLAVDNFAITSVSFNQDGSILASGGLDAAVKLWDVKTGKVIRTLEGHDALVTSVSFNQDSSILASGSEDNTIKLWDVKTGKVIRTLEGHDALVTSVSFNQDSSILASGSGDKTIKLWDVKTGQLIRTLKGHNDYVTSVSFNQDASILASGSGDKTIKLWYRNLDWDVKELIKGSCGWVRNYLTYNPNVNESDRHLCDGISTQK